MNNDVIKFLDKNLSKVLIGLGTVGIFVTTYLAVDNTFKAVERIQEAKKVKEDETGDSKLEPKEVVQVCAKEYIPTAIALTTTVACTCCAYSEEARKATITTMAYKTALDALSEKDGLVHKLSAAVGPKKSKEIEEEYANEQAEPYIRNMDATCIEATRHLRPGDQAELFIDLTQQRMYYSTESIIRDAFTKFKAEAIDDIMCDSFNFVDTYDETYAKPLNDLNSSQGISNSSVGDVLGYSKSQIESLKPKFSSMRLPNGDLVKTVKYSTPTTIV